MNTMKHVQTPDVGRVFDPGTNCGNVVAKPVTTPAQWREFLELPWTLYQDHPNWIPPLRSDQKEMVGFTHHPFYQHNRAQAFLAYRDQEVCGRILAIVKVGHLIGDLEAESIDFLDIVFRMEKAFDIKISRNELFPEDVLTEARYIAQDCLTDEGVAELRKRMPFANLDRFAQNPRVQELANVLTVADLCRFVEGKLRVES